ncbi:MAG: sulfur carrier protein ThiS [Prevotella sp.]|jgi:sulfur carrier protein|nr:MULTISPECIES: sulfur carrier protein ThiS [unclassified Prevotella]MCH3969664.1 sulfur carrier protein ThiS [Prevotella sp.]MCH3992764.1 sulfur carrier protein ThiS [Prevotella sp.]MCH4185457.1 sulfur carrier protein ThiS [Prevotella sp.]MCH4250654.1 sulfur carrier protein ThiS [Prevotella sp.]MCI1472859.1 sulfur carrier protein ThiS [Prevotella sp.]
MAQIIVNDEKQEVNLPLTLDKLIELNRVLQPDMLTVQVNSEFVEKEDYGTTELKEGDKVDFLYFMGGGSPR